MGKIIPFPSLLSPVIIEMCWFILEVKWFSSLVHRCIQSVLSDLLPTGAFGLAVRPKGDPIFLRQTMGLRLTMLGHILRYTVNAMSV